MANSGLHILSLDGGGVSVLSELLIVKELMARIAGKRGLQSSPSPHEYFHLIGGTGTGGLVAILLGRLNLDIDKAIECWLGVMEAVFTKEKVLKSEGVFKATALEEAIGEIVEKYSKQNKNMIQPDGDRSCKVVVYALNGDAMRAGVTTCIRNYRAHSNQGPECTIVEAVRATMASPTIFKPVAIREGGVTQTYVGGNLGINNPAEKLLDEVQSEQSVASIISIGAGQLHSARLTNRWGMNQKLSKRLETALKTMAQDCETTSEAMSKRFEGHEGYYRFNVEQGMQDLDPHSTDRMGDAKAHTLMYLKLREPDTRMNKAVEKILNGTGTMMIERGNVSAINNSNSTSTGFMPLSDEPESLVPRRPGLPSQRETEPIMGQMERLMSLGVPTQPLSA